MDKVMGNNKKVVCLVLLLVSVVSFSIATYFSFLNWYEDGRAIFPLAIQFISLFIGISCWFHLFIQQGRPRGKKDKSNGAV